MPNAKPLSFQNLILTLHDYWSRQGCVILQPYDIEVGAGTLHPSTVLRALGPKPWRAAYVQPSRRPSDGRYGENPNRLGHYYQYQVILKPNPPDMQALYLGSLEAIGIDSALHDLRFVEDDWENPTVGAWGLGWEVWCDGMEVSQYTYFQQVGGLDVDPVAGELTYGLERLCLYLQGKDRIMDLAFNDAGATYADVFLENERQFSAYSFEGADVDTLKRQFEDMERQVPLILEMKGPQGQALVLPAYDHVLKASHLFNLMDARGAIAVAERQSYIGRIRDLCKACALEWVRQQGGQRLMPQLLLELFSEEIPARMQTQAARDLERLARERLAEAGFLPEALKTFAGPRRLTLIVEGLPAAQADRTEERKGPRVGAPDAAIEGFLRSAGLTRDQLVERDGVWFATIAKTGRATTEIIAEMVDAIVRGFPWPKSMKWGTGTLRWVRPLQRILCVFDSEIVPFQIDGIPSGDLTEGHRFMGSRQAVRVRDFDQYAAALEANFVVLDVEQRRRIIQEGARTLCFARNLELIEEEGLLDEVAGLAEWPTPILGDMDPAFLDLPPEVIRTSMRTHQKYFTVRDPATGALAPNFLVVANIVASDGGAAVAEGNARVLSARLNDARFFWDEDRKTPLAARLEKLKGVTFHAKLGTMFQRVERIEALASQIAPLVGADPALAAQAARLSKADLGTGMVGEFPELQGLMGGYYARAEGLAADVSDAIRDHYRPQGPGDAVPTAPVSVAVALADKLDTLAGFFGCDEKPTGSRDPFALRRAALGIIRIALEDKVRVGLGDLIGRAGAIPAVVQDLLAFFADRLKVLLREQGKRHDLVDAVFALGDDDLVRIVARVEALDAFLKTEDGANLLAGYKRATNILKAEEKKAALPTGAAQRLAGAPAEETGLIDALEQSRPAVEAALATEDFAAAMRALAALRGPVDGFFDKVLVNADDARERENRLRLLAQVRAAMGLVADFSLVVG